MLNIKRELNENIYVFISGLSQPISADEIKVELQPNTYLCKEYEEATISGVFKGNKFSYTFKIIAYSVSTIGNITCVKLEVDEEKSNNISGFFIPMSVRN